MNRFKFLLKPAGMFFLPVFVYALANNATGQDTIAIHNVGHGSVYFEYKGLVIHADPYSAQADYNQLPDADLILVTHTHQDHYDPVALNAIKTDSSILICPQAVSDLGTYTGNKTVLANGDSITIRGITVKAVPAYNIVSSTIYHPKGVGNGYVVTLGEKRIYLAGDTENIPEMDSLDGTDIAFIPMNLPFTMTVEMAADAARKVMPDILYIYHFGTSDTARLRTLLSSEPMEIRMDESVYFESDKREPVTPTARRDISGENTVFYPNPVKNFLTIRNADPGSSILLFDASGHLLLKQELTGSGTRSINMRLFSPGLYILNYRTGGSVRSELVVKE